MEVSMKKAGSILCFVFIFLMAISCNSAFATDSKHYGIPVSSILSAAYDPVVNCVIEQVHQHDGIFYGGHFNNDGHGHHGLHADDVCTLSYCEEIYLHQHNGVHFAGHNGSGGCVGHSHKNGHGHSFRHRRF
jgi:hypothetical protein